MSNYQTRLNLITEDKPDIELLALLNKVLFTVGRGANKDQENAEESFLEVIEYHHGPDDKEPCKLISREKMDVPLTSAKIL